MENFTLSLRKIIDQENTLSLSWSLTCVVLRGCKTFIDNWSWANLSPNWQQLTWIMSFLTLNDFVDQNTRQKHKPLNFKAISFHYETLCKSQFKDQENQGRNFKGYNKDNFWWQNWLNVLNCCCFLKLLQISSKFFIYF